MPLSIIRPWWKSFMPPVSPGAGAISWRGHKPQPSPSGRIWKSTKKCSNSCTPKRCTAGTPGDPPTIVGSRSCRVPPLCVSLKVHDPAFFPRQPITERFTADIEALDYLLRPACQDHSRRTFGASLRSVLALGEKTCWSRNLLETPRVPSDNGRDRHSCKRIQTIEPPHSTWDSFVLLAPPIASSCLETAGQAPITKQV